MALTVSGALLFILGTMIHYNAWSHIDISDLAPVDVLEISLAVVASLAALGVCLFKRRIWAILALSVVAANHAGKSDMHSPRQSGSCKTGTGFSPNRHASNLAFMGDLDYLIPFVAVVASIFTFVYSVALFFKIFIGKQVTTTSPKRCNKSSYPK